MNFRYNKILRKISYNDKFTSMFFIHVSQIFTLLQVIALFIQIITLNNIFTIISLSLGAIGLFCLYLGHYSYKIKRNIY